MLKPKRLIASLALVSVITIGLASPVLAAEANKSKTTTTSKPADTSDASESVARSYGMGKPVQQGMIVQLNAKDASKVDPATSANSDKMFGVAVAVNDAALTISDGGTGGNQIYVATSGRYNMLVSSQNGEIKEGDYVTISSIDGIGMKASPQDNLAIGRAMAGFNGTSGAISSANLKDGNKSTKVAIGRIPVEIKVSHNPYGGRDFSSLPGILQATGDAVANKPVSTGRIFLALAVLLISALVSGSMLYSGVKNGMISVGRNPMAKKSIVRNLIQVILTSVIIFIIGLFGVYLLLRL